MRFNYRAMGPVLVGCAFLALTSCSKDSNEPSPGPAPMMNASVAAVSAYDIVKVSTMTVDGNLNDWVNIAAISMADNSGRAPGLDNTAKVKLAWSDTYLYVAYDVTDTELLAAQTTRDHPDVYKDDAVELYIDPQGDGGAATSMTPTDYQVLANVRETLGDFKGDGTGGKDVSFNAPSFLAKAVINGTLNGSGADVGYTEELRISWTDLGVTPVAGNFMRIDPGVDDNDTGNTTTQEFDWAGLTSFNNPSGWKDVQLVNRPPPVSAYDIVKVATGMTIDGSLADWAGVTPISMADNSGRSGGVDNTAKVRLAWDPTYLYMAYDVTDTELLAIETARDAANIYQDDEVELYIDPQGDGWTAPTMTPTDYQLLANARETLGDNKGTSAGGKDASFNPPSFLAKALLNGTLNLTGTDLGYTLEARISWADLGVTAVAGNFMRIDPVVGDRDGAGPPPTQAFDWAGLTAFNNPIGWKDVKLAIDNTAPATPTNVVLTVVSSSQVDVSWTASGSTDVAKYNIYRATTGTPTLYKTVTGSPYHDTGLAQGTTYTYQISAVDAAGNESAKTAVKSATTTGGAGSHALRVALFNTLNQIGNGPGGDASGPIYGAALGIPTPGNVASLITTANAKDVLLVLNLADSRQTWTTPSGSCNNYSQAKYRTQINRFLNIPELTAAFASRRAVVYLVDEPFHTTFCNTLTPALVNAMGTYVKSIWPGVITLVRAAGTEMRGGWDNSGTLGATFWTGVDYGWAQFEGPHTPSSSQTPAAFYAAEKAKLDTVNLGMVPGHNFLDGGNYTDLVPGAPACWDYSNNGSSSGLVKGTFSGTLPPGTTITCHNQGSETRFLSSPALLRAMMDATWNDPDAPFFAMWTHANTGDYTAPFVSYEARTDFKTALDDIINKGATRTTWNNWRPAK